MVKLQLGVSGTRSSLQYRNSWIKLSVKVLGFRIKALKSNSVIVIVAFCIKALISGQL